MPLLDSTSLASLRADQSRDAMLHKSCAKCSAQLWKNYCRQCDEFFVDGHFENCSDATKHQSNDHRTY